MNKCGEAAALAHSTTQSHTVTLLASSYYHPRTSFAFTLPHLCTAEGRFSRQQVRTCPSPSPRRRKNPHTPFIHT